MVQLHVQSPALVGDRHRRIQAAVLNPQLIEAAQRRSCEISKLRVVALGLQLGNHDQRDDDLVLGEPQKRGRVSEKNRGVQDIGAR